MSKTILSVVILILSQLLPLLGVELGSEELTAAAQTVVTLVTGIIIWVQRVKKGDVTAFGARKRI